MSPVFAECPVHGRFESNSIVIHPGVDVTGLGLGQNTEKCPVCGATSRTMEGNFDLVDGYVRMLSGPGWTRDLLAMARDSVASAKDKVSASDDALEIYQAIMSLKQEVHGVNAKLDGLIAENTAGKSKASLVLFLTTLLTLFTWAVPASETGRLTAEIVKEMARHALGQQP